MMNAKCILCKEPIKPGEPFITALVESDAGELGNQPFHLRCHMRDVAQLVADAVAEHLAQGSEGQALQINFNEG